jgi:hypothetical protein
MNNTKKANHYNGNSKGVRCLTNGKYWHRLKDAAKEVGVTSSTMSRACNKGGKCKGMEFGFEADKDKIIMKMASNLSEMEINRDEMAEFYQWKAEKEAEAKRLEAERKAKEDHAKEVAKATEKVARYEAEYERRKAKLKLCEDKLMAAQIELEALLDMEV